MIGRPADHHQGTTGPSLVSPWESRTAPRRLAPGLSARKRTIAMVDAHAALVDACGP